MSNQMPIYSHIVPKSHMKKSANAARNTRTRDTGQADPVNPKNGNSQYVKVCPNTGRPLRNTDSSQFEGRPSRNTDSGQFEGRPSRNTDSSQFEGRPSRNTDSSQFEGRPSRNTDSNQFEGRPLRNTDSSQFEGRPSRNIDSNQFDPLNYNHGGNFHQMNVPVEKYSVMEKDRRRKDEVRRRSQKVDSSEGKVEAYLRQNQVSIRQQHRHSVRQAEHRVNLRSLPLTEGYAPRVHERTPTDRPRGFPERERDGDRREHRRDREREAYIEGSSRTPLSPVVISRINQQAEQRVRKSSSSQRLEQPTFGGVTRRFHCREWAFQKLAHCLEQRPVSKTCGALILGDSGSGKTALCRQLTQPASGPQARQQRALNRRLLASHFMQSDKEGSLRTGEFVRSLAARLLTHSSRHCGAGADLHSPVLKHLADFDSPEETRRNNSEEEQLMRRLRLMGDDGEESSKPLLADSEDQRTDEEEPVMMRDAPLSGANELPEVMPRTTKPNTNPFIGNEDKKDSDMKIYENHENVYLRNISQRQSKELRNSRLLRQSSEPLSDKKANVLQKSHSTDPKADSTSSENENKEVKPKKEDNGSPTNAKISRIPVANFRYPNKSGLGSSSNENSPLKTKPAVAEVREKEKEKQKEEKETSEETPVEKEEVAEEVKEEDVIEDELPEYQNIIKPRSLNNAFDSEEPQTPDLEVLLEKKRSQTEDVPPPIPSLPVNPRTLIADAYYEKLISDPEIQESLLPQNLEKNPDECFKKAFLFPLLEIDPPKQCLFLLVDSIDEGALNGPATLNKDVEGRVVSRTVAELLANHHHLFPQWLLLVCTARKQSKSLTKMFTGFRKIALDELQRAHVSADVQRYVLARLDAEPRLRARVSSDAAAAAAAAAALDHLRIKSDGCLLYLEKVLDGIADGFIALREIREIPGTLNGLYLWLAQRIFHGRRFAKVRLMLDVLLAARCGVTEEMLYKCLLTNNYSLTRDDFNRRLHLLRRIVVVDQTTGFLSVFHHSFCSWLVDVKHCTRRYLCCPPLGHAALAMYYTLEARRLNALEIQNYVLHMTRLEQHLTSQRKNKDKSEDAPDLHTLVLLWIVDSGCRVETALHNDATSQPAAMKGIPEEEEEEANAKENSDEAVTSPGIQARDMDVSSLMERLSMRSEMAWTATPGKESDWVSALVSGLYCPTLTHDARVARCLAELGAAGAAGAGVDSLQLCADVEDEDDALDITASQMSLERQLTCDTEETADPAADALPVLSRATLEERTVAHQLAQRGDDERLEALLLTWPELVEALDAGGGTPLHVAARHGRAACAAALLRAGARADAADADGWSPLRAAAWAGHTEVVEVLLEHGCQVDCVDADNRTALRAAAWSGHGAVVGLLLAAGAEPDRADGEGRTPLIAAAYMGHADIVRDLLDAGADVDHADEDGRTALSVASLCSTGAQCAALLLERGADVTKADRDKATPLLVAAFEGHTEICELLLEQECDAEACDAAGRTALWAAASAGHAHTVRLLLFWGACVDNMDAEGRTVLSVAAAQGNVEVVRQLLDRGLDEHHRDNAGWTPLHYAAFEGHVEVCEALLEAGAKVDEADNDGKGALMLAAQEGHTRLVEIFLDDWGAPVDQHSHDGKTALRAAALEGHMECVAALHARGADADALDADRRSTLYVLALDNRLAMARYLVRQCGASVDTRDTEGRTPLHVSAWQGHTEMVNMLIKLGGAEVDGRDRCMRSALHAAAWRGRAAVLRTLLQHGADPAAVCTQGATPLGIAAQEGHEECVMWLLQHGADPLQADHCGRTPARVAWRAGHAGVCRLLERWSAPPGGAGALGATGAAAGAEAADTDTSGSTAETRACTAALVCPVTPHRQGSPELKRRSVHSTNSTKSSSNLTGGSALSAEASHQRQDTQPQHERRAALGLSFAQQVARCGRGQRERRHEPAPACGEPEPPAERKDPRLRSYAASEQDAALRGYARERESYRRWRERDGDTSPLYASPPRSPVGEICSPVQANAPFGSPQPTAAAVVFPSAPPAPPAPPTATDQHFARDTHMRIILGRDERSAVSAAPADSKGKRNGIVTNPAMRLVANMRNGLDHAAANIRRTGVALAASAGASNPAVKTDAFQWRRETPL